MATQEKQRNIVFRNLANIVSILGVLPICILFFGENVYLYLIPLILYNNVMDDLDGIVAAKLNIWSTLGPHLDNVCDAIAHTVFVMFVGIHFAQEAQVAGNPYTGGVCLASSLLATVAMIVRVVTRINPSAVAGTGSPTNELIRHIFFVLLLEQILEQIFEFDPTPYLIAAFFLHAVSMLVPFKMPYLIRSLTKSATAISLVNVALLAAWLYPYYAAPVVAASFVATYLVSFAVGAFRWLRKAESPTS